MRIGAPPVSRQLRSAICIPFQSPKRKLIHNPACRWRLPTLCSSASIR